MRANEIVEPISPYFLSLKEIKRNGFRGPQVSEGCSVVCSRSPRLECVLTLICRNDANVSRLFIWLIFVFTIIRVRLSFCKISVESRSLCRCERENVLFVIRDVLFQWMSVLIEPAGELFIEQLRALQRGYAQLTN